MRTSVRTLSPVRRIGAALALMALFLTPLRADEITISIQCSPFAVVLHAVRSGDWMTVHANIPYSSMKPDTVWLEAPKGSLKAASTFADDRGDLVAKFRMRDLISLLETTEPTNELTLIGFTQAGVAFAGTDTVRFVKK